MRFSIRGSDTETTQKDGDRRTSPTEGAHPTAQPDGVAPPDQVDAPEVEIQAAIPEGGEVASAGSPWVLVLRTFAQNKLAVIGIAVVILMVLFSFVGPLIYHTDQFNPDLTLSNAGPSSGHLLGNDDSGFDILGRLMEGGQSSLEVGLAVGFASTIIGLLYGAISGYIGGVFDGLLMRIVDIGYAIPVVFLFIFMSQIFTPNLTLLIALLVAVSWLIPARLVRGETLSLRTREYVQAVQVMGGRSGRIVLRHIIPNTIGVIMVTVTFQVANAILTLAVLQYLGFGLPASTPTWGTMLSNGTTFLQDAFDVRLQER